MLRPLTALVTTLLLAIGGSAVAAPAAAAGPTTLTVRAATGYAGQQVDVVVRLRSADGPAAGQQVQLERRRGESWVPVAVPGTTDDAGQVRTSVELSRTAADNVVRATYDGTLGQATARRQVDLQRRRGVVTLDGPRRVADGREITLAVRWRTGDGEPVRGRVTVIRRLGGGDWKRVARPRLGEDGRARVTATPREDSRWRVVARPLDWVGGDRSGVLAVDNVPPGVPVQLPARAPRPRVNLPDQPDAVGTGANAVVTGIPGGVWNQMTGRSWRRGCPVGRSSLRLLRVNYYDYQGYRHRGELVAHADAVGNMRGALVEMYDRKLPIRSMYRVDRFGFSRRVQGADDYRSMAAGNTSAFNCRNVVGRPGVRSPHSYGRALDINPWENPYRASHGWTPNSWWVGRSHPRVAWRSRGHQVVRLMARHGLRWTYGTSDAHHFDAPAGTGRAIVAEVAEACGDEVCH